MKANLLILAALIGACFTSCIKDEALNSEADIISFRLSDEVTFGEPQISNNDVILFVYRDADITKLSPVIEVSDGATINPSPSLEYDFTQEITFTITSENGKYSKPYTVKASKNDYHFDFEEWDPKQKNYPELAGGLWKSGNFGVWFMPPIGKKDNYPTSPTDECVEGSTAVKLETMEGKEVWGNLYSIFSGSVYYGSFTLIQQEPARGVRFGQPHPKEKGRPVRMTGYYKYKPGTRFLDKEGNEISGRVDECTARAFLYWVPKGLTGTALNNELLTGVDDILNSEKVVGIADLKDCTEKKEFTPFNLKFEYKKDKEINYDEYDYRLAIVFSSSKRGDFYEGAVGSTMIVDDVKVICEEF